MRIELRLRTALCKFRNYHDVCRKMQADVGRTACSWS